MPFDFCLFYAPAITETGRSRSDIGRYLLVWEMPRCAESPKYCLRACKSDTSDTPYLFLQRQERLFFDAAEEGPIGKASRQKESGGKLHWRRCDSSDRRIGDDAHCDMMEENYVYRKQTLCSVSSARRCREKQRCRSMKDFFKSCNYETTVGCRKKWERKDVVRT